MKLYIFAGVIAVTCAYVTGVHSSRAGATDPKPGDGKCYKFTQGEDGCGDCGGDTTCGDCIVGVPDNYCEPATYRNCYTQQEVEEVVRGHYYNETEWQCGAIYYCSPPSQCNGNDCSPGAYKEDLPGTFMLRVAGATCPEQT